MRGRLLNPFLIELAQLDTTATSLVVGGGYDPDFGEPRQVPDGSQFGADTRRETTLQLHAQIEPGMFNSMRSAPGGWVREARFVCVVHFLELETKGLLDPQGLPRIRINDRLSAVYESTGELVMQVQNPPGLYLRETLPIGFGLGGKRNLLQLEFRSRDQAR